MFKKIALLLLLIAPMSVFAQKFGKFKSNEIIPAMAEYTKAQSDMEAMSKQYQDEMKRAQDEFTKKYTEYQKEEANLPKNIQERRQKELQELNQKSIEFQQDAEKQLNTKYRELMEPILNKVSEAVKAVGQAGGYTFIFDLTSVEIPYVNDAQVTDVTSALKAKLGIK